MSHGFTRVLHCSAPTMGKSRMGILVLCLFLQVFYQKGLDVESISFYVQRRRKPRKEREAAEKQNKATGGKQARRPGGSGVRSARQPLVPSDRAHVPPQPRQMPRWW